MLEGLFGTTNFCDGYLERSPEVKSFAFKDDMRAIVRPMLRHGTYDEWSVPSIEKYARLPIRGIAKRCHHTSVTPGPRK